MKTIIGITFLSAILLGCKEDFGRKTINSGKTFMASSSSTIFCDSVNMISPTEADVYVDGVKTTIKTDNSITVWSNQQ